MNFGLKSEVFIMQCAIFEYGKNNKDIILNNVCNVYNIHKNNVCNIYNIHKNNHERNIFCHTLAPLKSIIIHQL